MKTLTKQQKDTINTIIAAKTRVLLDQEAISEDTNALAASLGVKAAAVTRTINLIMKEQSKGGAIDEETMVLELAEQAVGQEDKTND